MAVGKGSMARAAKTAETKNKSAEKESAVLQEVEKQTKPKKTAKPAAAKPKKEPDDDAGTQIIYQASDGVLDRAALPNEIFMIGDAMPVYYL